VLSCRPADEAALRALARQHGVPLLALGETGGEEIRLGPLALALSETRAAYEGGLAAALAGPLDRTGG
jgi:hypothetical protein